MSKSAGPTDEQIQTSAQAYVDAVAERDSRTPEDAARAAGANTDAQVAALATRIRADRQQNAQVPA